MTWLSDKVEEKCCHFWHFKTFKEHPLKGLVYNDLYAALIFIVFVLDWYKNKCRTGQEGYFISTILREFKIAVISGESSAKFPGPFDLKTIWPKIGREIGLSKSDPISAGKIWQKMAFTAQFCFEIYLPFTVWVRNWIFPSKLCPKVPIFLNFTQLRFIFSPLIPLRCTLRPLRTARPVGHTVLPFGAL